MAGAGQVIVDAHLNLVSKAANADFNLVSISIPRLLLYTPSKDLLASSCFPHGIPPKLFSENKLSVRPWCSDIQNQMTIWQQQAHIILEQRLGLIIDGYVTGIVALPYAPLIIRELPDAVGTKVWFGEWILWYSLISNVDHTTYVSHAYVNAKTVIELGAGCGLAGLILRFFLSFHKFSQA